MSLKILKTVCRQNFQLHGCMLECYKFRKTFSESDKKVVVVELKPFFEKLVIFPLFLW